MLLALLWGAYAARQQTRAETTRDSAVAVAVVLRAQNQALALSGDSLQTVARKGVQSAEEARRRADALRASLTHPPVPTPDTTLRDSLRFWRDSATVAQFGAETALRLSETLQGSLDSLTVAFEAQQAAAAHFRLAYEGERDRGDSLVAVLRTMPVGCKRLPLLGIPVPVVGIGYALTPKGIAPAVALTVPLGKC